jgi:hypothetical protein
MRRVITFEIRTWAKNGVEETHLVDVSESISKKVHNRDRHADPVLCDFMRLIEKLEMAKSIPTDSDTRRPLKACSTKRADRVPRGGVGF